MHLKYAATFVTFGLLTGNVFADSLYLKCTTVSATEITANDAYFSPPTNLRQQFMSDMLEAGLIGLLTPRPESWVVNISEKNIHSPEADSRITFSEATIDNTQVTAEHYMPYGSNSSWHLNRVTGKLTYRIFPRQEVLESWSQKHGGALPATWQWEQQCQGSSSPTL